uniref:Uncharacterized protein n=1 Tax=Chromera velia CCMP2878 TaxID=1169474 RepID=A0A0G4GI59_9ALVE|eukprot:Cvel_4748.t1-p1 / transcript=Cvel_4748.t1 / gene=Cvel_4748 / organism=Chromera_velia_CCMP2878 / gene_product=hypothetical protein / transcript_product=hypothetical protein / location=Cvel_scaffold211:105814-110724(-) / protein_length=969 / sequence_SO=supercontig / SO=protein_coding / is_pseudo=false
MKQNSQGCETEIQTDESLFFQHVAALIHADPTEFLRRLGAVGAETRRRPQECPVFMLHAVLSGSVGKKENLRADCEMGEEEEIIRQFWKRSPIPPQIRQCEYGCGASGIGRFIRKHKRKCILRPQHADASAEADAASEPDVEVHTVLNANGETVEILPTDVPDGRLVLVPVDEAKPLANVIVPTPAPIVHAEGPVLRPPVVTTKEISLQHIYGTGPEKLQGESLPAAAGETPAEKQRKAHAGSAAGASAGNSEAPSLSASHARALSQDNCMQTPVNKSGGSSDGSDFGDMRDVTGFFDIPPPCASQLHGGTDSMQGGKGPKKSGSKGSCAIGRNSGDAGGNSVGGPHAALSPDMSGGRPDPGGSVLSSVITQAASEGPGGAQWDMDKGGMFMGIRDMYNQNATCSKSDGSIMSVFQWHPDMERFGRVSDQNRRFTKMQHGGCVSLVYERELRCGGKHVYRYSILQGYLAPADGMGFVFGGCVPASKNVQHLQSIFLNRIGNVCIRQGGPTIVRADTSSLPRLNVGQEITLIVDLDLALACFEVRTRERAPYFVDRGRDNPHGPPRTDMRRQPPPLPPHVIDGPWRVFRTVVSFSSIANHRQGHFCCVVTETNTSVRVVDGSPEISPPVPFTLNKAGAEGGGVVCASSSTDPRSYAVVSSPPRHGGAAGEFSGRQRPPPFPPQGKEGPRPPALAQPMRQAGTSHPVAFVLPRNAVEQSKDAFLLKPPSPDGQKEENARTASDNDTVPAEDDEDDSKSTKTQVQTHPSRMQRLYSHGSDKTLENFDHPSFTIGAAAGGVPLSLPVSLATGSHWQTLNQLMIPQAQLLMNMNVNMTNMPFGQPGMTAPPFPVPHGPAGAVTFTPVGHANADPGAEATGMVQVPVQIPVSVSGMTGAQNGGQQEMMPLQLSVPVSMNMNMQMTSQAQALHPPPLGTTGGGFSFPSGQIGDGNSAQATGDGGARLAEITPSSGS